jgi:hypothetical protein
MKDARSPREERTNTVETNRVPLEKQNVLVGKTSPGHKGMWVNEFTGAVAAHELAGWKLVSDPNYKSNDGQIQSGSQLDSVVRRVVNRDPYASVKTAVWMEIPLEYYEEDHRAHQAEIEANERNYAQKGQNEYGDVSIFQK